MQLLAIDLNTPATYITVGPFTISPGNLVMVGVGIVLFVLALVLPFPGHGGKR